MKKLLLTAALLASAACEHVDLGSPDETGADLSKFVSIGTSITMGYASDGVYAASQQNSWPKLLANDVGVTFTLPLIDSPGCRPPFASPLSSLKRLDNTSVLVPSTTCAPNSAGVTLPAQNVAVTGQTANDAWSVYSEPGKVSSRVLASGQTQVLAMKAQSPTFVSVELGANDIFPALSGLVSPNTTVTPIETFTAAYKNVIDAVKATGAEALLVLVPADISKIPVVRTAAEIASQRTAFSLLNVSVNADCNNSPNLVTLTKVLATLNFAAQSAGSAPGPVDLSCADVPSSADGILSPAEVTALNTLAGQINTYITARAAENGYATMSLGALYDNVKTGVTFDLATILTSSTPWGPNISLDAVHPSAAGNQVLAAAAKAAITAKYGGIR